MKQLPTIPAGRKVLLRVLKVHDGDTLTATAAGIKYQIRLDGIDAPELAQPYGEQSRDALAAKVVGRQFNVLSQSVDKYGRTVGVIYARGDRKGKSATINGQMVQEGHAWMYRKYSGSQALLVYEALAQARGWGLWAAAEPEPPWAYRQRKKLKPPPAAPAPPVPVLEGPDVNRPAIDELDRALR